MDIERFIARWRGGEGGQERANSVMFLIELCDMLGVERPSAAGATHARNDYVFERAVRFGGDGPVGHIDLYKRGHFLLEAKQSRRAAATGESARGADQLMHRARRQAARYARALPADHSRPPFLIVCDVGRAFELLADFSGSGYSYDFFPDRTRARILIEDLVRPAVRALLRAIWTDPYSLDPARRIGTLPRPRRDPRRATLTAAMINGRGPFFPAARRYAAMPRPC